MQMGKRGGTFKHNRNSQQSKVDFKCSAGACIDSIVRTTYDYYHLLSVGLLISV